MKTAINKATMRANDALTIKAVSVGVSHDWATIDEAGFNVESELKDPAGTGDDVDVQIGSSISDIDRAVWNKCNLQEDIAVSWGSLLIPLLNIVHMLTGRVVPVHENSCSVNNFTWLLLFTQKHSLA